jgi:hypothetical protein
MSADNANVRHAAICAVVFLRAASLPRCFVFGTLRLLKAAEAMLSGVLASKNNCLKNRVTATGGVQRGNDLRAA